jgi:hypothetical protein
VAVYALVPDDGGLCLTARGVPLALLALALGLALALASGAEAKEIDSTTCGATRCRTATNLIVGIGSLPGKVAAPRSGRFYTIDIVGPYGWKVVYEARRRLVRAADFRARSFMGRGWSRLARELRPQYAAAVKGLAPMRAAPPYRA